MTQRARDLLDRPWFAACVIGGLAFALYLRTAARSATYGDGPELAAAAYQLGVAHPTGYPLYTLLAHLFIRIIPIGEVIFRTTLLSAITCAVSVGVLYLLALALLRRRWIAAFVAALIAVSDTLWGQAVLTEVYGLHMALTLSVLTCLVYWDRTGNAGFLRVAAVLFGLSLTHHLMTLTWIPAYVLIVWLSPHRAQLRLQWRAVCVGVFLPLLLYLYLPLAARRDPPLNWGDVRTFSNFVDHITGAQYRYRMGHKTFATWWNNVYNYGGWPEDHKCDGYLLTQFSIAIIWLAPIGIWSLARRNRRYLLVTIVAYLIPLGWALWYNIPDPEAYYLPSHVVVALWIGLGLRELEQRLALRLRRSRLTRSEMRRVRGLIQAGTLGLVLLILIPNFRTNDKSRLKEIGSLGRAALERAAPNSIILASGDDWGFALLYVQNVEGIRRDVRIIFEPYFQWRDWRLIQREAKRGVIVREPDCSLHAKNKDEHGLCRMKRFILDNYRRRTFYLAGPLAEELDKSRVTKRTLPHYERLVQKVPMLRFLPESKPDQPSPELGK